MSVKEIRQEENGVQLHMLPNKKHKTVTFAVKFSAPLEKETVTKRALIPYILKQGTESFPTRMELQKELAELYGSVLSINGTKKGESHIITFYLEVPNEKFLPDSNSVIERAVQLLHEIVNKPNQTGNAFHPRVFDREKEILLQNIKSIKDDKASYANIRLIDEMCSNEAYRTHVHGYEEDLNELTNEQLFAYYEQLRQKDRMDIYVSGDFDADKMTALLKGYFKQKEEVPKNVFETAVSSNEAEPKEVIEEDQLQQAKLHIGYRTNILFKDDLYAALQVFNGLFGGFPSSKLFINVREKNSLAYYASSRIESHKGLLMVVSGIAPEDYEKALTIIREQLEAMKKGDFKEEELEETKLLIINQLKETLDHTRGMIELMFQQEVGNKKMTVDQLFENIRQVTKEQVIEVAEQIQEDTVYLLTSKGGEAHE
ncbi:EF-P 5-aminopentanol modification-associated protein YfmF [Oceanobacillus sp. J11TS1]|uniref:EF-P 5-aminopentanol modification-associated protein YfmF n=1 Tax=Oceanobacillus sp. J11TS1 TaxID=2807191 RepID=UPI001B2B4A42|nr:pitrilysin family protein [Oceanobacillus sp. J11TS1]GIO22027.1 putative inactive metalloprotease YmfF [Oceanobacillus sp. J11TS1]